MEQLFILTDIQFHIQFIPFLNLRYGNMAGRRTYAEVHPMIHRRFPVIEVLCKLCILESAILERHPIIISLLLEISHEAAGQYSSSKRQPADFPMSNTTCESLKNGPE